jgi:hypothetical protein
MRERWIQGRDGLKNGVKRPTIFDIPATTADLTRPSLELHGLKDVEIVGIGKPRLIFANTRSHGIEISGCERLAIDNLYLDYDFKADFSAVAGAPDGFQVSPYGSSFYEAAGTYKTDSFGEVVVLSPIKPGNVNTISPADLRDFARSVRSAFMFKFGIQSPGTPALPGPKYYLDPSDGARLPNHRANMWAFDAGITHTTGSTNRFVSPKFSNLEPRETITLAKMRYGYGHAVYVRDFRQDLTNFRYLVAPNSDITLSGIRLYHYPQMGFVFQGGSRIKVAGIEITPAEGEHHSGRADAFHVQGVSDFEFTANTMRGQGDDGLNIRGLTVPINSMERATCVDADNIVRQVLKLNYPSGNLDAGLVRVGDSVVLASSQLMPLVSGRVESVQLNNLNRPSSARIVFGDPCDSTCIDRVIAAGNDGKGESPYPVVLFNMTRSGSRYYVHGGNRFEYSATRAMLLQSPNGVVQDSIVTSLSGTGIRLQAEANPHGFTGPGASNVVVRRNSIAKVDFDDVNFPVYNGGITVGLTDDESSVAPTDPASNFPLIQNILVQDNELQGLGRAAVTVSRAENVELSWSDPAKVWISDCFLAGHLKGPQWGVTDTIYKPTIGVRKAANVQIRLTSQQVRQCGTMP